MAVVPLVSLGYVNLAPCALKFVEVSVCACTCISRSLATGDCLPIEQSSHLNYCLIFCIDVFVKANREYTRLYQYSMYYHVWLEVANGI